MEYFPSDLIGFGIGLFIALNFVIFILITVKAHNRLNIEINKTPLYTSTAGGQIGWIRYRGPFVSIRIYDNFIVIGSAKTIVLRFEEIDRVEIKRWGAFTDRVQLIHHKLDAPSKIIIGTTNPTKVKEIIEKGIILNRPTRG
jgi:hypothetical protein